MADAFSMFYLYTVTLKVAEGLFNQSNAEYICSKSQKKKRDSRGILQSHCFKNWLLAGNKMHAYLAQNKGGQA